MLMRLLRSVGGTLADLRFMARNPSRAYQDVRSSANSLRDLCEGGIVISTAFPARASRPPEALAMRTVLQIGGDVSLLVDAGLADSDQAEIESVAQGHAVAVHDALGPLRRVQDIALGLRASLRVVPAALGLGSLALTDLMTALIVSTSTGAGLFAARRGLRYYVRHKAHKLLQDG
jgi:hypothetical protein